MDEILIDIIVFLIEVNPIFVQELLVGIGDVPKVVREIEDDDNRCFVQLIIQSRL
jgi:hypothetical protein